MTKKDKEIAAINDNGFDVAKAQYASDYMEGVLEHFREQEIVPTSVARALMDALFKYSPGDPYAKKPNEGDLWAGLSCLSPAEDNLKERVRVYNRALDRITAARPAENDEPMDPLCLVPMPDKDKEKIRAMLEAMAAGEASAEAGRPDGNPA
ncbi:hypothetical protein MKK84_00285 [Methylobacterium sp. E-065]|uniref:hypothetical protein n=1 Tax=Methylobacterium sp. E-065 TaxID=2836583 RepID=UPI001FBBAF06|nr:hypothetical protein [Methylobacterium sp. E-065]MCJ2015878.1 hypothetical protein [Methylobacterium sp. E-065]